MKQIATGELRQNPAKMIKDLEAGEPYILTMHGRAIGTIVPASGPTLIPPVKKGPASTSAIPKHKLRTARSIDKLLEDMKGDW